MRWQNGSVLSKPEREGGFSRSFNEGLVHSSNVLNEPVNHGWPVVSVVTTDLRRYAAEATGSAAIRATNEASNFSIGIGLPKR